MHSFHRLRDPRDPGEDVKRIHRLYVQLFNGLGPMYVRAWSDHEEWLGSLAVDFSVYAIPDTIDSFQLTPDEIKRTLAGSEGNTVYSVSDANLFARILLASIRHSELSTVFMPVDLPRKTVVKLLRFADYFHYERDESKFPVRIPWLLASTTVDEECDAVYFVSNESERYESVSKLLREAAVKQPSQF